jgi:ankyrin repeat protein
LDEASHSIQCLGLDVNASVQISPLLLACITGNYAMAKLVVDSGADVNAAGSSLLTEAIASPADEETKCKFVELLLSKGADIDRKNKKGETALQAAVFSHYIEVVRLLVRKGARVVDAETGRPVFAYEIRKVCCGEDFPLVEVLLETLPKAIGPNDTWVSPMLLHAVEHGDANGMRLIKMFTDRGANINVRDEEGNTLLLGACGHRTFYYDITNFNPEIVAFLLQNGADVHAASNDGRTALHSLCAADPDIDDDDDDDVEEEDDGDKSENGEADGKDEENERKDEDDKKEHGEKDGSNGENEDAYEDIASSPNVVGCVKLLLEHDADVDVCDNDGCSPLELAVQSGNNKVVDLLLPHLSEWPEY